MRALIVDDTPTIATLVQIYLVGWGLEFEVAKTGAEAMKAAKKARPDIIVSDVQMPDMDGFALCAALRSDPELKDVPVVLLTSLKDEASRKRAKIVGAERYLTKPVLPDVLRKEIAEILNLPLDKK